MVLDHKTNLGWTGFCIMNIKALHRTPIPPFIPQPLKLNRQATFQTLQEK